MDPAEIPSDLNLVLQTWQEPPIILEAQELSPWPFINALYYIKTTCSAAFYAYFIDGEKEWKQEKYFLSLLAISDAFKTQFKALLEFKETFAANEDSELKTTLLSLIDVIAQKNENAPLNPRDLHYQFIELLRKAILTDEADVEYTPFLEKVSLVHYTEVHLFSFCKNVIDMAIELGMREIHRNDSSQLKGIFPKELHEIPLSDQFLILEASPQEIKAPLVHLQFSRIRGACNIGFDAQNQGNIPYVLFDFNLSTKAIRALRSCTPTMQRNDYKSFTYQGHATIIPEFENFISALVTENTSLFYISMQNYQERHIASEKERNVSFIELNKKYPKTFHLTILAHDSSFYYQAAPFDQISDAAAFKALFMKEMLSEESGFFFAKNLMDEECFKLLLDEVHYDLYLDKQDLTHDERLDFIELYYTRLTLFLLKKSKANYIMNVCKHTADRAAIRNSLVHYLLLILYKKETSGDHLNDFYTLLHAGAFLMEKRAINSRKERLLSIMKRLESGEIKDRLRMRKDSIGIIGDDLFINKSP